MDLAITDSIKDKFQLLKDMDGEIFKAVLGNKMAVCWERQSLSLAIQLKRL